MLDTWAHKYTETLSNTLYSTFNIQNLFNIHNDIKLCVIHSTFKSENTHTHSRGHDCCGIKIPI